MNTIHETLSHLTIGPEASFRNLTMFPLLNGGGGEPDYFTLDEALAQGSARVTELSEGGTVPELKFVNDGERRVLLLDGEELIGAKQNRVLNLTILAPARRAIVIPVSCVEAGRWAHVSAEFFAADRAHYAKGRAMKMAQVSGAMVMTGTHYSDQGAVWADIARKSRRLHSESRTSAMAAMYETHAKPIEDYVGAFAAGEGQIGVLFAINGELIGCDLFDYSATLRKLLPKLVRSYALDAIDTPEAKAKSLSGDDVRAFLDEVASAQEQTFAAIGEGEDVRLTARSVTGAALIANERVVHLSAFRVENGHDGPERESRTTLQRASVRIRRHNASQFHVAVDKAKTWIARALR